ncbi:MAG TPA: CPBP family intramembrane glutamic endopeptidase [Steroidobacteraceae bacterium]
MLKALANRSLWLFLAVYGAAVAWLASSGQSLEDVLGAGLILGIGLPLAAWIACLGMPAPEPPQAWEPGDGRLLLLLVAWIILFLAFKGPLLDIFVSPGADPRLRDTVNTALKIAAFVAIPGALIGWQGRGWTQAGQATATITRIVLAFLLVAAAAFAVQFLIGSQFQKLLTGPYASRHLAVGAMFSFVWMSIEAGLVEEFFFRWYLQSRLAAWTGSQLSAVLLGALVFGVAHAPGMILRGAGLEEGLGASPPVMATFAYAITVQGLAGLVFGLLWARTRSFLPLVLLHGFVDALSNTAAFMDTWQL